MRKQHIKLKAVAITALMSPMTMSSLTFAADANVSSIETFIRTVVNIMASLAGLIAAAFFVWGGLGYITSSGNIERLDKSKRTLFHAGLGLVIVIAAFVIANIVTTIAQSAFGS